MKPKLKYYIPSPEIFAKTMTLVFITIIIAMWISGASAYTLTSSVSSTAIFKCQPVSIWANITNDINGVTGITVWVNSTNPVLTTGGQYQSTTASYTMANQGGNNWLYQYGNDASLLYGNKSVSFVVTDGLGMHYSPSIPMFYVYSDVCVGTGITNWSQVPSNGTGHYTSQIWKNNGNILDFALSPWIEYWGYEFYLIIIFLVCMSVYMKSQKVIEPILIAFVSLGILVTTTLPIIPPDFKQYIVMLLGIAVGSIMYKIFKG